MGGKWNGEHALEEYEDDYQHVVRADMAHEIGRIMRSDTRTQAGSSKRSWQRRRIVKCADCQIAKTCEKRKKDHLKSCVGGLPIKRRTKTSILDEIEKEARKI